VNGKIKVTTERAPTETCFFTFAVDGVKLQNFGLLNTIVPFIRLWKPELTDDVKAKLQSGEIKPMGLKAPRWNVIFEAAGKSANPNFPKGTLGALNLCDGNWQMPLRVFFDFLIFLV